MGRIKFLKIFDPNLAQLIKTIYNMLKIGNEVKWTKEATKPFEALQR